ncbi:hypothetical protein BDR03DRAFT_962387 [Suillus americanus]|nr:hypothetical protein BDR03DRAFT_962387 [Suillus americanus]
MIMIGPPCPHTHVVPLVSKLTLDRFLLSLLAHIPCLSCTLLLSTLTLDSKTCRRSMSASHPGTVRDLRWTLTTTSSSPTSPEARRNPPSLHSPGTVLPFSGFLPAASAAKRREPMSPGDRGLRVHCTGKSQPSVLRLHVIWESKS